jgi:hypothetical protein
MEGLRDYVGRGEKQRWAVLLRYPLIGLDVAPNLQWATAVSVQGTYCILLQEDRPQAGNSGYLPSTTVKHRLCVDVA